VYFHRLSRRKPVSMKKVRQCKVCQSKRALTIKRYEVNSSSYPDLRVVFGEGKALSVGLRLCNSCGFVYHDSILSLSELQKIYLQEDRISHKKEGIQKKMLLSRAVHFLNKYFDLKKISNAIDIGSGDFALLDSLSTHFPSVTFSAVNVSYKDDIRGKVKVFHTMLEDMTESDNRYRLVILSHILEHVADLDLFFDGLKKITRTETQLYIEVPFQVGPGILLGRGFHAQHINYFTPSTLRALLERFDYKLDNMEFDTQGGYYYYGIPGVIRAKFSRSTGHQKHIAGIGSFIASLFFLLDPTIYLSGRLKSFLFQRVV